MPTFATDIKPASTGLALGSDIQKWDAYIQNIFVDVIQTNTPNQAATGTFRLASLDTIAWRNSANTADVTLSKTNVASGTTPADVLAFNGAGIEGPIISHNLNPAAAGEIRLASTDVLAYRNNANTADIAALSHQTDDSLTVGGAAGVGIPGQLTVTGNVTLSGNVTVPNITATHVMSADIVGTLDTVVRGGDAVVANSDGGNVTIQGGIKTGSGLAGSVTLGASGTGAINIGTTGSNPVVNILTTVSKYNNISTQGQGLVPVYGVASQTSETAADTNVLTFTPPAAIGLYRISFSMAVSAQNTATLGWTATWTDSNANAQSPTNLALFKAGTAAPALTFVAATNGMYYGSIVVDVDNSATAIVAKLTFSGTSFTALVSATVERLV